MVITRFGGHPVTSYAATIREVHEGPCNVPQDEGRRSQHDSRDGCVYMRLQARCMELSCRKRQATKHGDSMSYLNLQVNDSLMSDRFSEGGVSARRTA